jgi:hypothetical protein
MPTYRNTLIRPVTFEVKLYGSDGQIRRYLVDFRAGEERKLPFALPNHAAKGVAVVDTAYPPLSDPIIFDNTLPYDAGVMREFAVRPCDKYLVQLIVQTGKITYQFGHTGVPASLDADLPTQTSFAKQVDWESAPLLVVKGAADGSSVSLHIEELQAGEWSSRGWR